MSFMLLALCLASGCARTTPCLGPGRPFEYATDTFAFANETVWKYEDGQHVSDNAGTNVKTEHYSRRCFLLSVSAIQFWKFARFEHDQPPVTAREMARRIRQVRGKAVWHDALPAEQRIVFPGFASLRDFSEHQGQLLRANLGPGWTTYFEPRKFSMTFVPDAEAQKQTSNLLSEWLRAGHPLVVWMYNFPHIDINHEKTFSHVHAQGRFCMIKLRSAIS